LFTGPLLAVTLVACGDDGGGTDTNDTPATSTASTASTEAMTSTTEGTAGTTDAVTTTDATTAAPMTTTGPDPTTDATTGAPMTTTDGTTTGDGLSWAVDVYPVVIGANCGCHNLGSGGLTMNDATDSYMNLVDVGSSEAAGFSRVATGDPANSYLVAKVKGVGSDPPFNAVSMSQMPLGAAALPPATIALLEQWIAGGALP